MDFIDRLLPRQGYYCAARLSPKGGFIHRFFDDTGSLKNHLLSMDAQGHTMYLAQASFDPEKIREAEEYNNSLPKGTPREQYKGLRTQTNAMYLRNFFIDIDCGAEKYLKEPNKSYPTQLEGAQALMAFCRETGLTFPSLVSSGHGLYAHWLIAEDVPAAQWKTLAQNLKNLIIAHKFKTDPPRTADSASVLRPVGTHNRKHNDCKDVKVLRDSPAIPLKFFVEALTAATSKAKIASVGLTPPKPFQGLNDEFTSGIEGPPSSLLKVAEKCAQIRKVRDTKGNVSEPLWYNFIGLARFTAEGKEGDIIHEWSQGHPEYSRELTDRKIRQHEGIGAGPTTCYKFGQDDPDGCLGCRLSDSVKSPILLGRPEPQNAESIPEEEVEYIPAGFRRTDDGLFYIDDNNLQKRFYSYDLYPTKIAFDHSLGYETVTIRHNSFRNREYKEFAVRSALVLSDPKQLFLALGDNHVQVSGGEERKQMAAYLDRYMADLRAKRDLATLHTQMGWKEEGDDKEFILGEEVFRRDGTERAGFARNIPTVARAFARKGSLSEWRKTTKVFGLRGMEPLAFAFLAGAFGAPLLRFTGFSGAMVALVGKSGIGKSVVGEMVMSVYGDPQKLVLLKDDTRNSLVARLGVYGSLPVYIDEVSNIEGQDLSDLLYRITQGRDKARLTRSGMERDNINYWNTIGVVSSNHSLLDKLSSLKADASAEINRVLEVTARKVDLFGREVATKVVNCFRENYGVAGPEYVEYLVRHQDSHRERLDKLMRDLDAKTGAANEERFWSAVAGCAIYGGLIARKLGLIEFEVAPIMNWLVEVVKGLRGDRNDLVVGQIDMIGRFMDDRLANGLFVKAGDSKSLVSILREPRGAIEYRVEIDTNRLYIRRDSLKEWLMKHYGSYSDLKAELSVAGALVDTGKRMALGKGTYISTAGAACWLIDLASPALGRQVMTLVKHVAEETREVGIGH